MTTTHRLMSLLNKITDKLLDEIVDWKKAAAYFSTGLAAFATGALTWLHGSFVLRGWWLATLVAYLVVLMVMAIAYLRGVLRRRREFREIRVEEPDARLEWRLRLDPERWVNTRLEGYSPDFISDILTGPFHLSDTADCSAEVGFTMDPGVRNHYRPVCSRCQPDEYRKRLPDTGQIAQIVRLAVAREIQRIFRTTERLRVRGRRRVLTLDPSAATNYLLGTAVAKPCAPESECKQNTQKASEEA